MPELYETSAMQEGMICGISFLTDFWKEKYLQ